MRRNVISVAVVFAGFVLGGCPTKLAGEPGQIGATVDAETPSGDPLVELGDVIITRQEIQKEFDSQSPFVRARYQTEEQRREFIATKVRMEILALEAIDRGMNKDKDVQDALKKLLAQKITRKEFDELVDPNNISDEEVRIYYSTHEDEYKKPEMFRLGHLFVAFGADREASRKKVDEAYREAMKDATNKEHLKVVLEKYSEDQQTRLVNGNLGYLTVAEVKQRYGSAAAALIGKEQTLDQLLPVVEGTTGFHIFMRVGYRKPIERSFEQVKGQIKNLIFREKRTAAFTAFVDELKEKFGYTFSDEEFAKLKVAPGMDAPPNMPHQPHGAGQHGLTPPPRGSPSSGQVQSSPHAAPRKAFPNRSNPELRQRSQPSPDSPAATPPPGAPQ